MTIKLNKITIDFDKIKKGTERIETLNITISSSESEYTIFAPDGYELIHPITKERVKKMTLTNEIPILDIYLLTDTGSYIFTDELEKIDFVE